MAEAAFDAGSIGPDVPPGSFPVRIHSVFRSAVNLQPFEGEDLITVLSREAPDGPRSVRLATTQDFRSHRLEPGSLGWFHEDGASLDRPGASGAFRISFLNADRLPRRALPLIRHLDGPWRADADLLDTFQAHAGADFRIRSLLAQDLPLGILGKRLTQAALELGESARTQRGSLRAVSRLVGLGSGLTPSGDDFLCGFMTAAHCRLRTPSGQTHFLREMKRAVRESLARTNAISATFLRCAMEGNVCAALHAWAVSLQTETGSRSALAELCAIGHSSGMDTATGFLYGLTVWG